jgi:hypothetical protein
MSLIVGVGLSTIPWGDSTGFHGRGLPFPSVIWDKPPGAAQFLDYPNPFGPIENVVVVFITGIMFFGTGRLISLFVRRLRKHELSTLSHKGSLPGKLQV